MYYQEVFSWAEDKNGKMVYVDDVPGGASCGCVCPSCRENLVARHGNERAHGFAHASKERGANLNICLKVIMFKLAEQIIATEKQICLPSYYGIFKSKNITFVTVEINDCFEREDRQPDIIAITKDGQKYLIEFCFKDYVRHKQKIDYVDLNCLEIDLSGQRINDRDSLKNFLLYSSEGKRWLNNDTYFNAIPDLYKTKGNAIRLMKSEECIQCKLRHSCCAVRYNNQRDFLQIEQNDKKYFLCKHDEYKQKMVDYDRQQEEIRRTWEENLKRYRERIESQKRINKEDRVVLPSQKIKIKQVSQNSISQNDKTIDSDDFSCFNCTRSLAWGKNREWAHCGCYESLGIPKKIDPDHAKICHYFKRKYN